MKANLEEAFAKNNRKEYLKYKDRINAKNDLLAYRQKLEMLNELKANIKNPYDLQENYHLFIEFIGLGGNWVTPSAW